MPGYALVMVPCVFCHRIISVNPNKAPSIRKTPNGPREAMCLPCHGRANEVRKAEGLEPWPEPAADAYEPVPEEEIRYD